MEVKDVALGKSGGVDRSEQWKFRRDKLEERCNRCQAVRERNVVRTTVAKTETCEGKCGGCYDGSAYYTNGEVAGVCGDCNGTLVFTQSKKVEKDLGEKDEEP